MIVTKLILEIYCLRKALAREMDCKIFKLQKTILMFLALSGSQVIAQLQDCSRCDTLIYTDEDIQENSITELQILRNEIFARHQYVFQNDRLLAHFLKEEWYQPNYKNPSENIQLSDIEIANVNLLLNKENTLLERRKRLVNELQILKKALHKNDLDTLKMYIGDVIAQEEYKYLKGFSEVFDKIELRNLNWYDDTALYQVKIDNGFYVKVTELRIKGDEIIFMDAHQEHSEIITKPFEFGSEYYSEDEHATFWIFDFDGMNLKLKEISVAG